MNSAKKKVLFICKNNSGRSQMAEAILESTYGNHYEVYSAGSDPKPINPITLKVLEEIGIDMSLKSSKSLDKFQGCEFDIVVFLCQEKEGICPIFVNGKKQIYQGFTDPRSFKGDKKSKIELFRQIRDEIKEWIEIEFE